MTPEQQREFNISALKQIFLAKQREYSFWQSTKKRIRPSERAMTLASLSEEMDALRWAMTLADDFNQRKKKEAGQ
jgi:hypothetical protein